MKTTLLALVALAAAVSADVIETASGLKYEILKPGKEGTEPHAGCTVSVHYDGTFTNGSSFDSSRERGQPFEFMLGTGAVIAGWDEGIALMTVGSKYRFHVPWRLAYGEAGGPGGRIGPRTDLVFEVELLSVKPGPEIPVFRPADPEKQKVTSTGIRWEVVKEGEGDPITVNQGVKLRYMLWNAEGQVVVCTESQGGNCITGAVPVLKINPRIETPFLSEVAPLMKRGGQYRFEVPPALCFGAQPVSAKLPANSTTIWQLEALDVFDIPAFSLGDPEKTKTTKSGLKYEVLQVGAGRSPGPTDTVTAHYTGWLTDGTLFDSSHGRGEPTAFPLNRVIKGWTEGLQLMREGGICRFTIPAELGYGARATGKIPPNATLVFVVELVKVGR